MGPRLIVLASALAVSLFHTEVFAQFSDVLGGLGGAPDSLKWFAFAAAVLLVASRRLR